MKKTVLVCDRKNCQEVVSDQPLHRQLRQNRYRSAAERRTNPAGSSESYYVIVDLCDLCAHIIEIEEAGFSNMPHEDAMDFLKDANCRWVRG